MQSQSTNIWQLLVFLCTICREEKDLLVINSDLQKILSKTLTIFNHKNEQTIDRIYAGLVKDFAENYTHVFSLFWSTPLCIQEQILFCICVSKFLTLRSSKMIRIVLLLLTELTFLGICLIFHLFYFAWHFLCDVSKNEIFWKELMVWNRQFWQNIWLQ